MAVNIDSVYSHKVWNETELSKMTGGNIPYPILSDVSGSIGKMYDVYDTQAGTTLRGTFIIDPQGYIHGAEVLTSPVGRNIDEIIRQIKAFQHYVSTGEVLPCGWTEGKKTIKPSIKNAGLIWQEWKAGD